MQPPLFRWALPDVGVYAITACLSEPGDPQPACSVTYAGKSDEEWAQRPFSGVMEASWAWELPTVDSGFEVNEEAELLIDSPVDGASALLARSHSHVLFRISDGRTKRLYCNICIFCVIASSTTEICRGAAAEH